MLIFFLLGYLKRRYNYQSSDPWAYLAGAVISFWLVISLGDNRVLMCGLRPGGCHAGHQSLGTVNFTRGELLPLGNVQQQMIETNHSNFLARCHIRGPKKLPNSSLLMAYQILHILMKSGMYNFTKPQHQRGVVVAKSSLGCRKWRAGMYFCP